MNAELAELAYGKSPEDVLRIAEEHGVKADENGLIEFDQPIGYGTDPETGEELPVWGIIDPSKATPLTEEEVAELEAQEAEAGTLAAARAATVYHWHLTYGGTRSFAASQASGTVAIQAVRISHRGVSARTGYNITYPSPGVPVTRYTSPTRSVPVIWHFSSTVYGRSVEIW